ncbi:myelin protein zero-like protein 1 [Pipistrellus kuhlii]|uniref:myelin protein zero-like protein 1 n=1 Tax=Pipistrellus kuhlii TaxID=59472 RepID=UPI00174F3DC7|nr:myelin protein zero-like protein 1 [Pipistrellus kuhlii]
MWTQPAGAWAWAGADTATRARWRCLWSVLAVALGLLTAGVSALEVITPKEIYVVYGTEGVLPCKFKSNITTGPATTVSWSFEPIESNTTVSFFYFVDGQVFPGNDPLFNNRVTWAGDLRNKDASIKIQNMQYDHYGYFICDVKNPPDIVSKPGYILLTVVEKELPTPPRTPRPRTLRPPQPRPPPPRTPQSHKPPWNPVSHVVGIAAAVILGLLLFLLFITLVLWYIKNRSIPDNTGAQ